MRKRVAFALKGRTFSKVVAPLLDAAVNSLADDIEPFLYVYRARPGKPADSVTEEMLASILAACSCDASMVHFVEDDRSLLASMVHDRIDFAMVQDVSSQFPFLMDRIKALSIGIFTDTMHYASMNRDRCRVPVWTYFHDASCQAKVQELSGLKWPGSCLGAPMLDQVKWLGSLTPPGDGSLLFMHPPLELFTHEQQHEIDTLCTKLVDEGKKVTVIVRRKHNNHVISSMGAQVIDVDTVPYESLSLLAQHDVHMNCYSISGFEARFLGRPALNLDTTCGNGSLGNVMVKGYGLDDVYDADNRITVRPDELLDAYERIVCMQNAPAFQSVPTHSIDILTHAIDTFG